MKTIKLVLPFLLVISIATLALAQEKQELNLLSGKIQQNGLPKDWITAADNFDCTIKFRNGAIYFERQTPDEKCSFALRKDLDNGNYLLKTKFEIDGDEPGIFLDGKPLLEQHEIKVTDGVLDVGIQTRGAGKVWGNISSMTLSKASQSSPVLSSATIEEITEIAAKSPISKYFWKDRGPAKIGYIKGVAVTYAKSYVELKTKQKTAVEVMGQPLGDPKKDALAHYALTANSDTDRLRAIYTLALGLGMRESDGNTTEGWDRDKLNHGIKNTEDNAEAGLFQVSWDSTFDTSRKSPWLLKLYEQYKAAPGQCSLSIFMEKVTDKKRPSVGDGDGARFQKFTKECPSFATEYVMIMLRSNRSHFGPINGKAAEYQVEAEKMFRDIEKVIDKRP